MKPNAYTTMQRARSLRERQPDASPSVVALALLLASYADGPTGTSIRPGLIALIEQSGLDRRTVQRGIRWLEDCGELRRDKQGHRGSAACFTWIGKGVTDAALSEQIGRHEGRKGCHSHRPTNQTPQNPSGVPGPRAGERCRKHPEVELYKGECVQCEHEEYVATHGRMSDLA
jgi:hypothetical protein